MFGLGKNGKHSQKWIHGSSDQELREERENVRKQYCASGTDERRATHFENVLRKFDDEISRRSHAGGSGKPGYPKHTKHGWYLPDDE